MKKIILAMIVLALIAAPFGLAVRDASTAARAEDAQVTDDAGEAAEAAETAAPEATEEIPELLTPVGVKMDSERAYRGAISEIVYYEGAVVAESHEGFFTVDGEIKDVNVRIGQDVKKGDVLITLNEEELEEQAEIIRERIDYQMQQDDYTRRLFQYDIDLMQIDLMRMTDENADAQEIRLLEEDIRNRNTELRQLKESQSLLIDTYQNELSAIESKLGFDEIVAPCDGRVAYLRSLDEGDFVSAYETLVCVTDDDALLVETQLCDSMIPLAHHYYAMIGEKRYQVELIETDWQENIVISLEGGELMSRFQIVDADEDIAAGLYVCVCLETKYVEDALIIPKNALNSDMSGRFVYLDQDGARVRRNVKVGITTTTQAEVIEGLEEGDEVYVKD